MFKYSNLKGMTFGQLVVKGVSKERPTAHMYWDCVCSCGTKHVVRGTLLIDGTVTRCRKCANRAGIETREERVIKGLKKGVIKGLEKQPKLVNDQFAWNVHTAAMKLLREGVKGAAEIVELAYAEIKRI